MDATFLEGSAAVGWKPRTTPWHWYQVFFQLQALYLRLSADDASNGFCRTLRATPVDPCAATIEGWGKPNHVRGDQFRVGGARRSPSAYDA
jgi:hypothetical protein